MNLVVMMGRLTREPEVRYGGANNTAVARYNIAVDRRFHRDGEPEADFFNVVSFGKQGEFVEKYLHKGTKIVIKGELHNDNYEKDGQKIYGNEIVTDSVEFAESKNASQNNSGGDTPAPTTDDGFMNIPEGFDDSELPFN